MQIGMVDETMMTEDIRHTSIGSSSAAEMGMFATAELGSFGPAEVETAITEKPTVSRVVWLRRVGWWG